MSSSTNISTTTTTDEIRTKGVEETPEVVDSIIITTTADPEGDLATEVTEAPEVIGSKAREEGTEATDRVTADLPLYGFHGALDDLEKFTKSKLN